MQKLIYIIMPNELRELNKDYLDKGWKVVNIAVTESGSAYILIERQ